MNMTSLEIKDNLTHYSKVKNTRSKQQVMEVANFCGHANDVPMESGLALIRKFSLPKEPNTSIKSTSEPNTTTILTISTLPQFKEICSSIMMPTISPTEIIIGSSKGKDSMLLQQLI